MATNLRLSLTNKFSLLWPWPIPKIIQMKKTHFDITTSHLQPQWPNLFFWILALKRICRTHKVPFLGRHFGYLWTTHSLPLHKFTKDRAILFTLQVLLINQASLLERNMEALKFAPLILGFFFNLLQKRTTQDWQLKNQHVKDQELSVQWFQPTWNKCVSS